MTACTAPVKAARRHTTALEMTSGELSGHGNFTYANDILPLTLLRYQMTG